MYYCLWTLKCQLTFLSACACTNDVTSAGQADRRKRKWVNLLPHDLRRSRKVRRIFWQWIPVECGHKTGWGWLVHLVAWHSGRTSVFDRRTLCPALDLQLTTYVGKPSAVDQPTMPTQSFILSGRQMSSSGCPQPQSGEAPSGERLRGERRHGVVCRLYCVIYVERLEDEMLVI